MSRGTEAVMRTRCPACATIFRVTPEQLRLKAGKVRCGNCQNVFNAFDQLVTEEAPVSASLPPAPFASAPLKPPRAATEAVAVKFKAAPLVKAEPAVSPPPSARPAPPPPAAPMPESAWADTILPVVALPEEVVPPPPPPVTPPPQTAAPTAVQSVIASEPVPDIAKADDDTDADDAADETPEQSAQAARQAGLAAVRELSEAPDYDRWAAGTLAGATPAFAIEENRRAAWPFVLAALLLILVLLAQLLHHFRTEVTLKLPAAADYYQMLNIAVPLPRDVNLVAIEASDLQSDNARGLFVLHATLRNRAAHAQDWPALELTLTDANDRVVARRVMAATEYLPPAISPERFPANSDTAIHLWLEARDIGAAGYRLYVFYP